jgi:hypothetical protein
MMDVAGLSDHHADLFFVVLAFIGCIGLIGLSRLKFLLLPEASNLDLSPLIILGLILSGSLLFLNLVRLNLPAVASLVDLV